MKIVKTVEPEASGMSLYLMLRGMCIDACERGEVVAVVFEESVG